MTRGCATVNASRLAVETVRIMEEKRISALLVIDAETRLVGALNMHDVLKAGIV
jgi:arabinose-5-phosphate isomerase